MKSNGVSRGAAERRAILDAVLRTSAATSTAVREAVFSGAGMPSVLEDYVRKVRSESYRLADEDVKRLAASGYSEDMIFEITIAAALGAADKRLQAGLRALIDHAA